jgi:hypothetical protein
MKFAISGGVTHVDDDAVADRISEKIPIDGANNLIENIAGEATREVNGKLDGDPAHPL